MGQVVLRENKYDKAKEFFDGAYLQINALNITDNTELLFELSQISFWQGTVEFEQQKYGAALAHYQTYLDKANQLVSLNPDNSTWQLEKIYARQNIASMKYRLGQTNIARQMIDDIIDDVNKLSDPITDSQYSKNLAFIYAWAADIYEKTDNSKAINFREPVSYTHLTLPTICSV